MVAVTSHSRALDRGHAHVLERRSPQQAAGASLSSSSSGTSSALPNITTTAISSAVKSLPPLDSATVRALVGIVTVLAVLILGLVGWRLRTRIRRRAAVVAMSSSSYVSEKAISLGSSHVDIEKPQEAVLVPPKAAPGTVWVPQIKSVHSVPISIASLEHVEKKSSRRSKNQWTKSGSVHITIPGYSPLPNYQDGKVPAIPLPPLPSEEDEKKSLTRIPTPPTPPVSLKVKLSSADGKSCSIIPRSPLRTSSFPVNPAVAPSKGSKRFPRLMTVAQTFEPNLEDELCVRLGETLRLIEEYEDEWCLVQRIGKVDAPKGVIPCFCLAERQEVVPRQR